MEEQKDFMSLVDSHVEKYDCKRSVAIKSVAKANPEAHRAYIQKYSKKKEIKPFVKHDFLGKVQNYQDLKHCSFNEALKQGVRRFPAEHQAYVESVN